MSPMANSVRIIGGDLKGRVLQFPDLLGLRPTPDRVRETLFNWLGQRLDHSVCLDLFSGSGALSFEAVSRGANNVVAVDLSQKACASIRDNCQKIGISNLSVTCADALDFLRHKQRDFDVVFLDPPFAQQHLIEDVFSVLPNHLANGCKIYIETALPIMNPIGFNVIKGAKAGRVHFALWEYRNQDEK